MTWDPERLLDRHAKEEREARSLAPYAMVGARSLGRRHDEPRDELRTEWERDRDRVVHSTAFRRLMYKTQVFVNWEGDQYRTRLSHSLEVCQVARSVGSALSLNEPLCEVLALAHDIGHPPFGHRGEWVLDRLMEGHGGFRHNRQVLRVVDLLERRSPDYPGLNLTRETRESLLKHEAVEDWPEEFAPRPAQPCLEAQVVDLADSTAYDAHDVEDGLRAEIFAEDAIGRASSLWREAAAAVGRRHPRFLGDTTDVALRVKRVTNELIKLVINDLIRSSHARLRAERPTSPDDVRGREAMLIGHSDAMAAAVRELQVFLEEAFYKHPRLQELSRHAAEVLEALFTTLVARPEELAPWFRDWMEEVGRERAVCDYLAGMTDRFAEREFERLTGRPPAWKGSRG